mmetsp:Transcript_9782/g.36500  ORF Transcript_9782/g.36500 Transcript_9782/m.36500 type:complete len:88 (-) Transcript_9782:2529-2792(-)
MPFKMENASELKHQKNEGNRDHVTRKNLEFKLTVLLLDLWCDQHKCHREGGIEVATFDCPSTCCGFVHNRPESDISCKSDKSQGSSL